MGRLAGGTSQGERTLTLGTEYPQGDAAEHTIMLTVKIVREGTG
jgi:hypothetical protein